MKLYLIIEMFKEHMADANMPLLIIFGFLGLCAFLVILWRWGSGFLMGMTIILSGLLLAISPTLSGLAIILRFPLVVLLAVYAFFNRRNKAHFSKAAAIWLMLPIVMLLNSARAIAPLDALIQSLLYFLFFIGLIWGGQKILGDARGRAVYTKTVVWFTIVMSCINLPYLWVSAGRLEGVFKSTVGFMIVGMTGVIVLTWACLKQRVWSLRFLFYLFFAALTFILMLMTGGRTSLAGTFLGVLVLLSRRLKRNLVVSLAVLVIFAPVGLKLVASLPGFEDVILKLTHRGTTGRLALYEDAWYHIEQEPWIGNGTGSAFIFSSVESGMTYHQSYFEFAVDHGIPFAILMMLLFLWFPFRGMFLMRRCQTEEMKDMANLSSAFLTGYVFSSFLGGVLNATTFVLPIFSGIALQEGVRAEEIEMRLHGLAEPGQEDLWNYDVDPMAQGEVATWQ